MMVIFVGFMFVILEINNLFLLLFLYRYLVFFKIDSLFVILFIGFNNGSFVLLCIVLYVIVDMCFFSNVFNKGLFVVRCR